MTDLPTASHDGTVERTGDGGVIRFRRVLPHAVADVWDAITDPARLADWWLPFDADITVDLREGGEMLFVGRGDDAPTLRCTILRLEPPSHFEHTHPGGGMMRWELRALDGGCELRLSHVLGGGDADVDAAIARCYVVGLHTSLGRLEPALAGRPQPWDWDAFAAAQAAYAALGLAPEVAS